MAKAPENVLDVLQSEEKVNKLNKLKEEVKNHFNLSDEEVEVLGSVLNAAANQQVNTEEELAGIFNAAGAGLLDGMSSKAGVAAKVLAGIVALGVAAGGAWFLNDCFKGGSKTTKKKQSLIEFVDDLYDADDPLR
ncbi:MAG: hypothetical protein LBR79_06320 [Oscillospiraceae bacterium]|jgi:hypothetical protein|nr:hypothetical protein [Oscillospiraceae bacterium]